MSGPGEIASTEGIVASEAAAPKVVSMEAPATMPMTPRSLRSKPTPVRENPKPKKDKQKRLMLVRKSLRKHSAT